MPSDDQTGSSLPDTDINAAVERAFDETNVELVPVSTDSVEAYRSDDAERAWQAMHEVTRGREVPVLVEMLDGTWLGGEGRWKAVTFLGLSLRASAESAMQEAALRALCAKAAVAERGSAPPDAVRVQSAALDAIAQSPATADRKWQCMLEALQASRSSYTEIVRKLGHFRPSNLEAIPDAQPTLLDAVERAEHDTDLESLTRLIGELKCRNAIPHLRRLVLAVNSCTSARVARVLADWGDKGAVPEIRRAIESYRFANDVNVDAMVSALHALDGAHCGEYIGDVLRTASPGLQEHLLRNALVGIRDQPVIAAVREIVASTTDQDLEAAANEFLESLGATVATGGGPPPTAAPGGTAAPPDAAEESPPLETETAAALWEPRLVDEDLQGSEQTATAGVDTGVGVARHPARGSTSGSENVETWRPSASALSHSAAIPPAPSPRRQLERLELTVVVLAIVAALWLVFGR